MEEDTSRSAGPGAGDNAGDSSRVDARRKKGKEDEVVGTYPSEWVNVTTITSDGIAASTDTLQAHVAMPSDLAFVSPQMWSAALACAVTKRASALAFARHHRAMTSPDVMGEIGPAFHEFSSDETQ